jgi:internalin A
VGRRQSWNERILTEIRNADVVIMLMSAYFIDSDYIWEKEIKIALENRKRGKLLLPVYVKAFDFSNLTWKPKKETLKEGDSEVEEFELSKIQWMPFNADRKLQAVATWQDRDEALAEVARKIREAITRFDTEDK